MYMDKKKKAKESSSIAPSDRQDQVKIDIQVQQSCNTIP